MAKRGIRAAFYDTKRASAYAPSKIKGRAAKSFLGKQLAYQLHKKVVRKFPRRKTLVARPHHQFQADLADFSNLAKHNSHFKYLLTVLDVFTRMAYVRPLKNKTGRLTAEALQSIFASVKKPPKLLHTDGGSEFYNPSVRKVLKKLKIKLFSTSQKATKASLIERFQKTLKGRIYRYLTATGTYRYVDKLQDFVDAYNKSTHRTLKMSPLQASEDTSVFHTLYEKNKKKRKTPSFKVGTFVRKVLPAKSPFQKGYLQTFGDQYYRVVKVLKTNPPTYKIANLDGNTLHGTHYAQQLQGLPVEPTFGRVETVLKRGKGSTKLVKFRGFEEPVWVKKVYKRGRIAKYAT
jgi:hypothetical protein